MRVTRAWLNSLEPTHKGEYADDEVPGLRLRVSDKGGRSWSILVTPPNGRRKRLTIGSALIITPKQAREKARQLSAQARLGMTPRKASRSGPTIKKLFEAYQLSHDWAKLADSTRANWQSYFGVHILPHLGNRAPDSITKQDLRTWSGEVAKETPTAANRSFEALKRLYNWALDGNLIDCPNPLLRLPKPSPELQRDRVYTDAELKRALEATAGTPVEVLFRLLMLTMLRSGETRAIRLSWFDWQTNVLTLPAPATKSGTTHPVPLSTDAAFLLRGMGGVHEDSPVDRAKREAPAGADPALFPANTQDGTMGLPHRWMREIGEKAGIKELRLHDVRRTGASRLEDLQVESDVIEAALGHSRPSLTKTYRPGFPTAKVRTALTKLADHWREALGDAWWEPDEEEAESHRCGVCRVGHVARV